MEFSLDSHNAQCGLIVISYHLRFITIRSCQTNLSSYFADIFQGKEVGIVNWYFRNAFYKAFCNSFTGMMKKFMLNASKIRYISNWMKNYSQ